MAPTSYTFSLFRDQQWQISIGPASDRMLSSRVLLFGIAAVRQSRHYSAIVLGIPFQNFSHRNTNTCPASPRKACSSQRISGYLNLLHSKWAMVTCVCSIHDVIYGRLIILKAAFTNYGK